MPACAMAGEVIVGEFIAAGLDAAAGSSALANPKFSTFTVPSARTLDVRGFQIAMDDPLLVRGFQWASHFVGADARAGGQTHAWRILSRFDSCHGAPRAQSRFLPAPASEGGD